MIPPIVRIAILDACVGQAVSPNDVAAKHGKRAVVAVRRVAMRRLIEHGFTQGQIARWWGMRQQSVSHALLGEPHGCA